MAGLAAAAGAASREGVPAIHLAAQAGCREVIALLELGADPEIVDELHGGTELVLARVGSHELLASVRMKSLALA
jgi:hypothetical protein